MYEFPPELSNLHKSRNTRLYNSLLYLQNLRGLFYDHSDLSQISQIRQMFAFY